MKNAYFLFFFLFCFGNAAAAQNCADLIPIVVEVLPDQWNAEETDWQLLDDIGTVLASGSVAGDTVCVEPTGCFNFVINDTYGDGIVQDGYCKVYYNGDMIVEYGNFGHYAHIEFGACPAGSSCFFAEPITTADFNIVQTASLDNTWYSFVPDSTGTYKITACDLGNTCQPTIWVYDHCSNLIWDDTQIASIYVINDNCDIQPTLITNLVANETYYIRIGGVGDACAGQNIAWQMWFGGPITGCMNVAACNYNPLATIDAPETCLFAGDPECNDFLPDLMVVPEAIANSLHLDHLTNNDECLVAEGCVNGYQDREILRFTTHIKNIGNRDYYIGAVPSNVATPSTQFEWSPCHNHWHYGGYAEYLLYDMDNNEIPAGFKNGFCVMDLECSDGGEAKYGCNIMGISAGCGDIYDSGLGCQWIDITDVPAGIYTLVVRVNWDNSPDNLGYYESNHVNNWAQVCINIVRNEAGAATAVTLVEDCSPYVDCAGEIYGNAQTDCTGTCGGTTKAGDLDQNGIYHSDDILAYLQGILGSTITATPCNDVNADGQITVSDASMVKACMLQSAGQHTEPQGSTPHTHCNLPSAIVTNPNDTAFLSITNINTTDKYFDVTIRNPLAYIYDYQFYVSGVNLAGALSIVAQEGYNVDLFNNLNGVIGLTPTETPLSRYTTATAFLRVYYTNITASEICLMPVEVINTNYERVVVIVENNCLPAYQFTGINTTANNNALQVAVVPNPFDKTAILHFNNPKQQAYQLTITNTNGQVVRTYNQITTNQVLINKNELPAGIYIYHLTGKETQIGKLILVD